MVARVTRYATVAISSTYFQKMDASDALSVAIPGRQVHVREARVRALRRRGVAVQERLVDVERRARDRLDGAVVLGLLGTGALRSATARAATSATSVASSASTASQ